MRRWVVILAAVGAFTTLVAVASGSRSTPRATHVTGTVTLVHSGGVDFGSEDGSEFVKLMEKQGITVKSSYIGDVSSADRALISGQADLLINDLPDGILAVANGGAKIKLVAANNQASDYILVGQKGDTLKNLKGKSLAIDTPGSAGEVAALLALKKAGVDPNSVHPVTIGDSGARATAILAGRVDLAPIHYGSALATLKAAKGKVIETLDIGKTLGPYLQSGLWANDSFLQNTQLAQAVVNDFILAERWSATNGAGYIKLANSEDASNGLSHSDEMKVWKYYDHVNYFGVNGGICTPYIDATDKLNIAVKAIPKKLPPKSEWLDQTFVKNFLVAHHQKPTAC